MIKLHSVSHGPLRFPKEMYKKIREFNDTLIKKALELKGTVTGEHGVGLHKKEYLLKEHGDNIPLMKLIKKVLTKTI